LVLPVFWLLWHRLWIEALVALAVIFAIAALGGLAGYEVVGWAVSLLVGLYVGLEGAVLRVAALVRRGWTAWGVVEADSVDDAETRFVLDFDPTEPIAVEAPPAAAQHPRASHYRPSADGPGLLLNSGDR
jgi:hypothetical protein